jgi:predicted ATPase
MGELLLIGGDGTALKTVQYFREAIVLTRLQSAKSWQLRTTMSLARLLDQQQHRDETRMMLAEIYNWFTEGFDTADLKDAKELLEELATLARVGSLCRLKYGAAANSRSACSLEPARLICVKKQ